MQFYATTLGAKADTEMIGGRLMFDACGLGPTPALRAISYASIQRPATAPTP
jgi:hypothetical protein